jgi:hypothetical protein
MNVFGYTVRSYIATGTQKRGGKTMKQPAILIAILIPCWSLPSSVIDVSVSSGNAVAESKEVSDFSHARRSGCGQLAVIKV